LRMALSTTVAISDSSSGGSQKSKFHDSMYAIAGDSHQRR
jgi:hypothetical protein